MANFATDSKNDCKVIEISSNDEKGDVAVAANTNESSIVKSIKIEKDVLLFSKKMFAPHWTP